MKGAIFYASKYGSTGQYATWISEATGLPVFDVDDETADPSAYDFLVLGSAVIYYKLLICDWVQRHWASIADKPSILFTVSGAPGGKKLNAWIGDSLPHEFISGTRHVALRGRQNPKELTWYDWVMLRIGALKNPDPVARREELEGFDFMDKSSIAPVVALAQELGGGDLREPMPRAS